MFSDFLKYFFKMLLVTLSRYLSMWIIKLEDAMNISFRLKPFIAIAFVSCLLSLSFAANDSKVPSTIPGLGINNVHLVAPGVYRGQNPVGKVLELHKLGIKTIVALRPNNEAESSEIKRDGTMEFIEIPMRWKSLPSDYTFDNQIKNALGYIALALAHPRKCTVYIHCTYGEDRTGLIFGLYRMLHDGWTRNQAWSEMIQYGYKTDEKAFITAELTKTFNRWADAIEWGEISWENILMTF